MSNLPKSEIINEIGKLETELAADEMTYRQWEALSHKGSNQSGCGVAILGLLLSLVLPIVGVPMIVLGLVLAVLNNSAAQKKALEQMKIGQETIAEKRGRLAKLQAQLSIA